MEVTAPGGTSGQVGVPAPQSIAYTSSGTGNASYAGYQNGYHLFDVGPGTTTFECSNPTAIVLERFTARRVRSGVALSWRTGSELGLTGFNVYRGGSRLNRTLIAARGSQAGISYRFFNRHPGRLPARYRLQAVRLDGSRAWLGSARVR
jgi:hypothetical protein